MIPAIYRNPAHPYYRWRYEGLITLANPPIVDDFQVQVTIPYHLGMNVDFSDLRFADVYGNAVSYWIESQTDGSTATVWVKIPSKDSSIFFYWGNELATSESSGEAVFDFFDDFSTLDTSKWTTAGSPTVSDGELRLVSGQSVVSKNAFGVNTVFETTATPVSTQNTYFGYRADANNRAEFIQNVSVAGWISSVNFAPGGSLYTDFFASSGKRKFAIKRAGGSQNIYIVDGSTAGTVASRVTSANCYIRLLKETGSTASTFDYVLIRKYVATEPTASISYVGTNGHYRRVVIVDTGGGGESDTLSFTTSLTLTPSAPSLFLTTDALSLQSNIQVASVAGIADRIPLVSALNLASTFDRMRSFGDISALASESVDISKSINDTMWVLTTTVRGDSPTEFFHYAYETEDHTGTDQVIFTGFTPDTVNRHTALQNQSDVVMYDYGWYLSAQYLPDDALVINLGGSRTTWAEWIRYLLEGTGITPYRIASSSADDKEFNFTARTTKRDAIDAISQYCGFIFVVGWNTSTPPEPIAYWIDQENIDNPSAGLDLPAAVTITWPDPHLVDIPSVQGTPEEKINRVRIRGSDTSGNWYSATMQTPALTSGEEIAREYYEESSAWNSQAKVNARALALYNYFTTVTYTVEAKLLKRMDLRLYQKIRFQGSGFSSKVTALGWLRIIEINYHISGIEKHVTIKAVTDKGQLSLLLERMNYAAGGTISDIDTIVSNQIGAIPMTEVGTVLSISGDIATVQTESGKIVQARIIS